MTSSTPIIQFIIVMTVAVILDSISPVIIAVMVKTSHCLVIILSSLLSWSKLVVVIVIVLIRCHRCNTSSYIVILVVIFTLTLVIFDVRRHCQVSPCVEVVVEIHLDVSSIIFIVFIVI